MKHKILFDETIKREVEVKLPYFTKDICHFWCIIRPDLIHQITIMSDQSSMDSITFNRPFAGVLDSPTCPPEEFYLAWERVKKYQENLHFENSFKQFNPEKMSISVDLDLDQS